MLLRKCMYIIICTLWCSCLVRCATDKADAKEHDLEVFEEPYKMAVRYENLDDKEYAKEIVNKFIRLLAKKDLMMVNDYVRKDSLYESLYEKGWERGNDVGVLKNELEHVQHKLEIAETKMNLHPYIESKEYDLLPHWLIRMTCSRRLKWVTALKFELTIVAKNLAKRLRENNIDIEYFVTIIIKCIGVKADCHQQLTTWVAPTQKKWKVLAKELGFSSEESNYLWYIVEKTEMKVKQIGKTVNYAWVYIARLNPQSNYTTVQNLIKEYLGEYAPRVLDTIHHVENKKFSGEVTVYLQPVTYREAIEIRKKVCQELARKQLYCSAYHGTKVFPEGVIKDEYFEDLTTEQPMVQPSGEKG